MKKLICVAMCLLLCLLACAAMADTQYEENGYRISVNEETREVTILGMVKDYAKASVPEYLHGYPVTAIGPEAFMGSMRLESMELPATVKVIGVRAFANCSDLETVVMPGVTTICESAFEGSTVHKLTLPNTLTEIATRAFADCQKLNNLELPGSLTTVNTEVFSGSMLNSVIVDEGVTTFADLAFYGCAALEQINLPKSLVNVGLNPFMGCGKLQEIKVSYTHPVLKNINGALIDMTTGRLICYAAGRADTEFVVPEEVKEIGVAAFYKSYNLQKLTVPATVEKVSDYAFWYCINLVEADVAEGVTVHPTAFTACYTKQGMIFPDQTRGHEVPILPN